MIAPGAELSDWLKWLETLSPKEIDLGLDRVRVVLDRLQLDRPGHVLLIAGTNGKGSSVAILTSLLSAAGLRVGAYTSPHICRYNERICVDGVAASDAEIVAAFEVVESVRGGEMLTYFEFGTLAAAVVFAAADLDVWVLEVGLGGRLDASNAIEPTASLISNIALDHCDWLGNDLESIAREKAGVMRPARPTIFGAQSMPDAIESEAAAIGASLLRAGKDFEIAESDEHTWRWRGPTQSLPSLPSPGLLGGFQLQNVSAVLALLDVTGLLAMLEVEGIREVLPQITLTGRSQRIHDGGREWWLDVAHNPAAAAALASALVDVPADGKTIALVGVLDDKDLVGVIEPLLDRVNCWVAITAASARAVPADDLARRIANLSSRPCLVADSVADAVEFARRETAENDRILVTGSFFTVGPVLDYLATDSRCD